MLAKSKLTISQEFAAKLICLQPHGNVVMSRMPIPGSLDDEPAFPAPTDHAVGAGWVARVDF